MKTDLLFLLAIIVIVAVIFTAVVQVTQIVLSITAAIIGVLLIGGVIVALLRGR